MGKCGPQLFLDDLFLSQDFIHSKAAPLLQSIESQSSTQGLFGFADSSGFTTVAMAGQDPCFLEIPGVPGSRIQQPQRN